MIILRKPKHKKEVIATDKGWVVKETGEILVRVKDLDKKIREHKEYIDTEIVPSLADNQTTSNETESDASKEQESSSEDDDKASEEKAGKAAETQPQQKPKSRRGRKPKNASTAK